MASNEATVLPGSRPARSLWVTAIRSTVFSRISAPAAVSLLALIACVYAAGLTQGVPFFDDDHGWLAGAQAAGWDELLRDVVRPVPSAWGFQDRPVQKLCFKVLHSVFGETPEPYHAFKAFAFAGVVASIAVVCLLMGATLATAVLAGMLFGLSSPVFAGTLWIADFELLAQLLMLVAFGLFLFSETRRLFSSNLLRFRLYQIGFVLASVLAHRTKGSAKLIPLIVLLYILVHRRDALRRWAAPLAAVAVTVIPFFVLVTQPIPFLPFADIHSQGWMWQPASLDSLRMLLLGNLHPFMGTTNGDVAFGLLAVFAPVLLWGTAGAAGWCIYRRLPVFDSPLAVFCGIWLSVVIVSFSAFPMLPPAFMARYLTGALIPASILIGVLLARVRASLPSRLQTLGSVGIVLLVVPYAWTNIGHTRALRDSLGQLMVANDRARKTVAATIRDADVLLVGLSYGYDRTLSDGNRYLDDPREVDLSRPIYALVQHEGNIQQPDYETAVRNMQPFVKQLPVDPSVHRIGVRRAGLFHGLTGSLYDRWVYGDTRSYLAILFEIVPESMPDEADKKGNLP